MHVIYSDKLMWYSSHTNVLTQAFTKKSFIMQNVRHITNQNATHIAEITITI